MAVSHRTLYSAVIITKNEAAHIEACIASIRPITDDIIVIDSGSTDATVTIAKSAGAQVYFHKWEGYGVNKNYGIQLAKNDWILSIDGDEVIDETLQQAILTMTPSLDTIYQMNSLVRYGDRWIRNSGWYPIWKNRLHNRSMAQWNLSPVHEDLVSERPMKHQKLDGHLLHYSYTSPQQHREKIEQYAQLQARKWKETGRQIGIFRELLGGGFQFIKTYIFQLGFLDGKAGFTIAKMNAILEKRKIYFYRKLKKG